MKNLRLIRFYDNRRYEPSEFRNKGLRGWWIRVLNSIRLFIECRVVYHVLKLHIGAAGPLADQDAILRVFEDDVRRERKQQISPDSPPTPVPSTGGSLHDHKKAVRKVENPREVTARVMERYAAEPRTRRYAASKNRRVIMEVPTEQETDNASEEISSGSYSAPARNAGQETRRPSLRAYPDDATETAAGSAADDESAEEFTGWDEPAGDDSAVVRERLSAGTRAREAAAAATEHQRSVVP